MNSPVDWISSDRSIQTYYSDPNRAEKQSLTFNQFLSLKLKVGGNLHLLSSTVIDFEYSGNDEQVRKTIDEYKKNYKSGKKSTIGQSLVALAYYGGYKDFLKTQAGDLPIAGNLKVNDPRDYHDYIENFIKFVNNSEFGEIQMVGRSRYDEGVTSTSKVFRQDALNRELSREVGGAFGNSEKKDSNAVEIKISSLNTILEGVAGCGKTFYQNSLFAPKGVNYRLGFNFNCSETVVFHPSTSYEDFVSGLRPQKNGSFIGKSGVFIELCNRAAADQKNNYLLFIDEINRANTAKVFGDLLMVIEESKRTPKELLSKYGRAVLTRQEAKELEGTHHEGKEIEHTTVRIQTAVDDIHGITEMPAEPLEYLAVPDNLYIVGTMNSTDRSVGTIDLALRRRFTWQTMEPLTAEELRKESKIENRSDLEELEEVLTWFDSANDELMTKVGPDARLGHSYFFQQNKSAQQIAHDLLKQLAEIAYIFHLEDLMAEEPFNQPILGLHLKNVGEGLGQKVIVEQISANSREETSGESKIELTAPEESPKNSAES